MSLTREQATCIKNWIELAQGELDQARLHLAHAEMRIHQSRAVIDWGVDWEDVRSMLITFGHAITTHRQELESRAAQLFKDFPK